MVKPPLRTKYKSALHRLADDQLYSRLFFDWKTGRAMRFDFSIYL